MQNCALFNCFYRALFGVRSSTAIISVNSNWQPVPLLNALHTFVLLQAAEKALKAVQYSIDADNVTRDHNLVWLCGGFNDSELTSLASGLEKVVVHWARLRYPDQLSFPKIPNEVYSAQKAEEALQLSENILMRVKDRIP